jgi:hypothetical protein
MLLGWGAGSGEASSPLKALLHTYDKSKGLGAANRGRHSDAEVDKLVKQALATVDADARGALLAKATEKAVGENYGVIPMHYQVNTWAAKAGYKYLPRTDERTIVTGLCGPSINLVVHRDDTVVLTNCLFSGLSKKCSACISIDGCKGLFDKFVNFSIGMTATVSSTQTF